MHSIKRALGFLSERAGREYGGNVGLAFSLRCEQSETSRKSVKNRQGGLGSIRSDLAFSFGSFSLRLRQRK
jgi:hypothetical protein